jgi:DNA-binding transcriptional LysR family regulator
MEPNNTSLDPIRQLRSNAVIAYAESDIDLSWLTDFMALTKCGCFSLAAAPHHPAGPSADESRRWSNAPEPPVRTRSRAVTLTEAGWRLVPDTDTLHRQVDESRTDARAGSQVSVELAAPQPFAVFSDWIAVICGRLSLGRVQLAFESLAGCERLIDDG